MHYSSTFMQMGWRHYAWATHIPLELQTEAEKPEEDHNRHAARELRDARLPVISSHSAVQKWLWYARTSHAHMERMKLQWLVARNGHHLKNRERREASPRCGFLTHGSFLFKPLQYPTNCTIITRHTSILVLTLRDWQNKKYPHMYGSLLFFPNTLEICFGSV